LAYYTILHLSKWLIINTAARISRISLTPSTVHSPESSVTLGEAQKEAVAVAGGRSLYASRLPALNYYQQICSLDSQNPKLQSCHPLSILYVYVCVCVCACVCVFVSIPGPHVTAVQIFSKTKLIPIFVFVENFGVANIYNNNRHRRR